MLTNSNPRNIGDHHLEVLRGWPRPHALEFVAPLATPDSADVEVLSGRVGTLNSDGNLVMGLLHQAMPIFIRQDSDHYDVSPFPGATAGRKFGHNGPVVSGVVATGAYEVATTEFVGASFLPNDPLTSYTEDDLGASDKDEAGKLVLANGFYNDDVCGVVSRGLRLNKEGTTQQLCFWTVFLPRNWVNTQYY